MGQIGSPVCESRRERRDFPTYIYAFWQRLKINTKQMDKGEDDITRDTPTFILPFLKKLGPHIHQVVSQVL